MPALCESDVVLSSDVTASVEILRILGGEHHGLAEDCGRNWRAFATHYLVSF